MKPLIPEHSQFNELARKKPIAMPSTMEEIEHYSEFYRDEVPEYYPLFLFTYLFGTRISESIGVKAKSLTMEKVNKDKVLVIRVLTLKNRRMPFRTLPLPLKGKEKKMGEVLWKYRQDFDLDENLFPDMTRFKAYWHFKKLKININAVMLKPRSFINIENYKMHPHFLRHCRLTHLVINHNYSIPKLMQYAGWTNANPAMIYVQLNWKDLMKGMDG